jgi:hypothetical protein
VAVAVEILGVQAGLLLEFGPGAGGGPQSVRGIQVAFCAVGGEAGEDVEGLLVEEAGDEGVCAVAFKEGFDQVQGAHRAGHLAGVGVAVHPEGGFLGGGAGPVVCEFEQPYRAPLPALAHRYQLAQTRMLRRERL